MTSPKTVAATKAIVDEDARVTVQEIADRVGIRSSSALRELHNDLGLHELSARWIPNILSDQNKGARLDYAQKLLKVYKNCDKRRIAEIVTGDETWIYFFEPHRKSQNKIWRPKGASPSKIARRSKSTKKVMYTIFFSTLRVFCFKYLAKTKNILIANSTPKRF